MKMVHELQGRRLKLQESSERLQSCMTVLESQHAWQDHLVRLSAPLQQYQAAVEVGTFHAMISGGRLAGSMTHVYLPTRPARSCCMLACSTLLQHPQVCSTWLTLVDDAGPSDLGPADGRQYQKAVSQAQLAGEEAQAAARGPTEDDLHATVAHGALVDDTPFELVQNRRTRRRANFAVRSDRLN